MNHINSLPTYQSHYCRKETSKLYLPSHYTLNKCYERYKQLFENPVSRQIYEYKMHEANIKVKEPKKDTCSTCDAYKMKIRHSDDVEKEKLIKEQENHHKLAELSYETINRQGKNEK